YEALLWVNGVPFGTFCNKILINDHGNHYCNLILKEAEAGERVSVALESYAGHYVMGTAPFEQQERPSYQYTYRGATECLPSGSFAMFLAVTFIMSSEEMVLSSNLSANDDSANVLLSLLKSLSEI
ncbi:hypothetical protein, partial [Parasutterella excrementihominis]|uniref:hypothetical protein n=1 Tax=Parasutterella excrementihominis TaxID=487175 RepID=UPI0027B8CD4D